MSKLEKLIIPLIDDNITSMDLTAAAGFIDSYTSDPDKPNGDKEIYLVYNDKIRNDYVTQRAVRFDSSKMLKRKYVKLVNSIPYYVYVFYINSKIKVSTDGILHLTKEQKITVLQFWGFPDDLVNMLVDNSSILADYVHEMPLADYYSDEYYDEGLEIQKRGLYREIPSPLFFCITV